MSHKMTTGHVFKFDAENSMGLFVIFQIHSRPFARVRFLDATNDNDACIELGRIFAGYFKPASEGVQRIARGEMKRLGHYTVLTNN